MTAPVRMPPRWHWRNWPLLVKLIAVLLVPTAVALVMGVLRIVDQSSAAPGYDRINEVAGVQRQLSALVGELQRERAGAAQYVADQRSGDASSLQQRFAGTDAAVAQLRQAAAGIEGLDGTGFREAVDALGGLAPLRQRVLAGSGPADVVIAEYGAAIDPLLTLDAALTRELDDVAVAAQAAALHALVTAREQVAQQHAVILPALIAEQLDAATIEAVRAADVRLQSALDSFRSSLPPAQQARYVEPVTAGPEQARQQLLALILDRGLSGEPLDVSVSAWDARTAAVTGQLRESEQALREQVSATATSLRAEARSAAGWNAVFLLVALALGVVVGIVIARSMLRPLGVLRRSALDVAGRRLPQAMATIRDGGTPEGVAPVPVHTREEIGQVARAFDEVHAQALRLATEQAQLRSNIDDIFVNLSRRSQGLVQRQLKLIDELEGNEQDPEVLDNLFQLDHLATRMRRNSENLLVLAGTESSKRTARPVSVVDVLRAAVSEVEQYQRVVLQPPPELLVVGRAATDLVHLTAELLDNATHFSPPDSQVLTSARPADDSSLVIEIDDRGVGMGEFELAEANERLATSPTADPSVSRRMGLFVVGRLAGRHGVVVSLSPGEDGIGVTASITVPSGLVRSAGSPPGPVSGTAGTVARDGAARAGANGNGAVASNGALPRRGSSPPESAEEPPRRGDDRVVAPGPAPTPPWPPVNDAGSASGADLFRPTDGRPAAPEPDTPQPDTPQPDTPQGPSRRVILEQATPIFDLVASAWFSENKHVPGNWTPAGHPQRGGGSDGEQRAVPASGRGPSGRPGQVTWGSADQGWQAAGALLRSSDGDVTGVGLPRREPMAQLVPGAADTSGVPGEPQPRSADSVRGRLASYQRGVREGRRSRHGSGSEDDGRHGTAEETQ